MNINEVCKLVEECFELPDGSVSAETVSTDIADWDSLGHFAILEFIEAKFPGVLDANPGLAQASSISDLHELGLKKI
jgi:acyl carrier protein